MLQSQTQSIPRDKFLTIAANLLHKGLLEVSRTEAKSIYKDIEKGLPAYLATVQMEDESTVNFKVTLDHSEFKGRINFGAFRASLALLVSNLGRALNDKQEIATFSAQNDQSSMIFGVTAITQEDNTANIMVLGADTANSQASVIFRLMYIDDSQFISPQPQSEQSP